MTDALNTRIEAALASIAAASTLELLDAERVAVVGKSGFVTEQLKQLGKLPAEERKAAGETDPHPDPEKSGSPRPARS